MAETVQLLFAARAPPLKERVAGGPKAATATPPQFAASALGDAKARFVGKVSLNATPVRGDAFGFVRVIVMEVVPPTPTVPTPKAFAMVGGDNTCAEAETAQKKKAAPAKRILV